MEELQGDFALNKHGWFTVQNVAENDFLNGKLTDTTYGIWYSVQFQGNAETFLWQTKTAPVKGQKYWGWLETTKSGKSVKFKWDKQNAPSTQENPSQGSYVAQEAKEDSIARAVALKAAVEFLAAHGDLSDDVLGLAELYLAWLQNSGEQTVSSVSGTPQNAPNVVDKSPPAAGIEPDYNDPEVLNNLFPEE